MTHHLKDPHSFIHPVCSSIWKTSTGNNHYNFLQFTPLLKRIYNIFFIIMLILFAKIYNNNVKISLMLNLPKNPLLSFNLFAVCYFFSFFILFYDTAAAQCDRFFNTKIIFSLLLFFRGKNGWMRKRIIIIIIILLFGFINQSVFYYYIVDPFSI